VLVSGTFDPVIANPAHIPLGYASVAPEVRDHDPTLALFSGRKAWTR
jgi:release factor glutamine methyltransferase